MPAMQGTTILGLPPDALLHIVTKLPDMQDRQVAAAAARRRTPPHAAARRHRRGRRPARAAGCT